MPTNTKQRSQEIQTAAAHLTDASYTGSTDVALDLTGGLDSTGYSLEDGTAEEIYELLCC